MRINPFKTSPTKRTNIVGFIQFKTSPTKRTDIVRQVRAFGKRAGAFSHSHDLADSLSNEEPFKNRH